MVLEDAVREVFGDDTDIVLWLRHPDAVRHLLRGIHSLATGDVCADPECHILVHVEAHTRLCKTAAALRALKDSRALVDIDRAYNEARLGRHHARLIAAQPLPTGVPPGGSPSAQ